MNAHDEAIRAVLLPRLREKSPTALLVQEWAIDRAVVDVGLVHDTAIEGFEIKSAADSVTRLQTQEPVYSRCFDRCHLVTAPNHLRHALKTLPAWWAIWIFEDGRLRLERAARRNPAPHPADLLWSAELRKLVVHYGLQRRAKECEMDLVAQYTMPPWSLSTRRAPTKRALMDALAGAPRLRHAVCGVLRARKDWRTPEGRSQRAATARAEMARLRGVA